MTDEDGLVVSTFKDVKLKLNDILSGMDDGVIKDYLIKSFNDGLDQQIILHTPPKQNDENSKSK